MWAPWGELWHYPWATARIRSLSVMEPSVKAGTGRDDPLVLALRAAGFTEIGTLWQYGDNRILCAVLGGL